MNGKTKERMEQILEEIQKRLYQCLEERESSCMIFEINVYQGGVNNCHYTKKQNLPLVKE